MSMFNMKSPVLYILIGLPGSGKSTYAKELSKNHNANIHSSDAIREELSGSINNQHINSEVFKILHERIKKDLNDGNNSIYDACNISYKRRMGFLKELDKIKCFKTAIIIATPYEECVKQNNNRDRKVPLKVIKRMYFNFDIPYWYEGWDEIEIYRTNDNNYKYYGGLFSFLCNSNIEQYNEHHHETIGKHCVSTMYFLPKGLPFYIYEAAHLHDCGKLKTMSFLNSKEEIGTQAHYYNHEKVGSYDSMFYDIKDAFDARVANSVNDYYLKMSILIRWHMQPHFWKDSKNSEEKYENLWGKNLYRDIMLLHEADKKAH